MEKPADASVRTRSAIAGFFGDCRGIAATEFAVIVPIMLLLLFSTVEICSALAVDRKGYAPRHQFRRFDSAEHDRNGPDDACDYSEPVYHFQRGQHHLHAVAGRFRDAAVGHDAQRCRLCYSATIDLRVLSFGAVARDLPDLVTAA
jgi:hypothetical protein